MQTSNASPLMGRRTGAPWYVYDEARPRDIVRLDKRRIRRFEQSDLAADLAEQSFDPFVVTDEPDLADWRQEQWDRIDAEDMADRADETSRLRAERITDSDFDFDAECGWAAPTALVWSDHADNSVYDNADGFHPADAEWE